MSSLTLEGLSEWWPSQDRASEHCLDDDQLFMSLLSPSEATLHDAYCRRPSFLGVTALGRSILLTARPCSGGVAVLDPTKGRCVRLLYAALTSAQTPPLSEVLQTLRTRPEQVRFVPRPLAANGRVPSAKELSECFRFACPSQSVWPAMSRVHAFLSCRGASRALSVMLSGPSGTGKSHVVRSMLAAIPACFSYGTTKGQCSATVVVTRRCLNLSALLEGAFSSSMQAEAVLKALRPPPVLLRGGEIPECEDKLVSVLAIHLQAAELLCASCEKPFVHVAAETLARAVAGWDAAQPRCCRLLLLCDVEEPQLLLPVLAGQNILSMVHLELGPPNEQMRAVLIREMLHLDSAEADYAAARCFPKAASVKLVRAACRPGGEVEDALRVRREAGVVPSAHDDAFGTVVGLQPIVRDIRRLLLAPLVQPGLLATMGMRCPKGALLVGPTGCGKTLMCACVARALRAGPGPQIDVLLVDSLTLIDKHVGQTEKNVSAMFASARSRAPCVLIVDNIDAIAPPRDKPRHESASAADRSLSTLLVEMDGVRAGVGAPVVVVASARSQDALDAALCRPGRLDLVLSLPLPDPQALATLATASLLRLFAGRESCCDKLYEETLKVFQRYQGQLSFADASSIARAVVLDTAPERNPEHSSPPPQLGDVLLSLEHHVLGEN
jgi:hypothetical protein